MYVVVVYDADPEEQDALRRLLSKHLNRIQNSVYAGSLRRIEVETLRTALRGVVERGRVQMWIMADEPATDHFGTQDDQENRFI